MALVWLPLDDGTVDRMLALARSSWARSDLDDAWAATGWALPAGMSVACQVFDDRTYTFGTGNRLLRLAMRFEPDVITGFSVDFATYADTADPDAADLGPDALGSGWSADPDATRADFDARWREGVEAVAARLGEPLAVGRHGERWHHAVWRSEDALVVAAQGRNPDEYTGVDDALLWVVRHPRDAELPRGDDLYDLLCGA